MSLKLYEENDVQRLADAIRTKNGKADKYKLSEMPEAVESITTGSVTGTGQYLVQVVDYDGTVLKSDHLNTGDTFTLPEAPTHDKLVFQGWSSPVNITDNKVTVDNQDITIGPMYTTASGLSEFDITLTKVTGLTVTFNMVGNKNWGDGTSNSETTHTYSNYGNYTITCDGTALPSYIIGQSSSAYNYTLTDVRLGSSVTSIEQYAFRYCYSLTNITIPNSITSIGWYAFSDCYSLTSITIPSSVTSIQSYVLYSCRSLVSITIPSSVTIIESSAFGYCRSLASITIPNSVIRIENSAFSYCYILTSITIPEGVTSIGNSAFYYCYGLTNITIPNSVTRIENSAFSSCYSLTSITIPASVTIIRSSVFNSCSSLTSITIPSSVTSIENYTFTDCVSLTSITIPEGVTSIGSTAFSGCYSITEYDFSTATAVPTLVNTSAFNGINNICKIIVPDALYDEWIAATNWTTYANYIYKVSEVYPPEPTPEPTPANYFKISDGSINGFSTEGQALYDSGELTELVLPSSYSRGEEQEVTAVFESYDLLDSFMVENGFYPVTVQVGSLSQMFVFNNFDEFSDKYEQLYDESNFIVTYRFIPSIDGNDYAVTSIGIGAFEYCSALTSITIPNSVTSIGNNAFQNCSSLTSITIPSGVTSIGNQAFSGCSSLASIKVDSSNAIYDSRNNCNAIIEKSSNTLISGCKNTVIPNSVTSIGSSAFSGCSGLTSITIPNSVTSIGSNAFYHCSSLISIDLSNASNLTNIGQGAFSSCLSLTNITIPSSVTSISDYAFSGCSGLTSITIPTSVTSIGSSAFYGCRSLTNITIPSSVTSIGDYAFSGCSGLTSITIPSSVTSIGGEAFMDCNGLTEMTILATTPPTLLNTNAISSATTTIYIPAGTLSAYQTATNWSAFADKFVELSE